MGTSKSFTTPAGGAWTSPKRQLTDFVHDQTGSRAPFDAQRFVRSALGALGGIGIKPRISTGGDGNPSRPSPHGGGVRRRTRRRGSGSSSPGGGAALGSAVQGLGG